MVIVVIVGDGLTTIDSPPTRPRLSVSIVSGAKKASTTFARCNILNWRGGRGIMDKMLANVFLGKNKIQVQEVEKPTAGVGEAVIRVTLTTICGTDLHIVRGEYPVKSGLIIGHEPVGVIEELGPGVTGYQVGERVLVGAITPCGQCRACLSGQLAQCGHGQGYEPIGGWRFGNTINGAQAEYLLVPYAQANLAKVPGELTEEQV